jgi:hypothetical protein
MQISPPNSVHDLLSQNRGLSLHPNPRSLNLAVWKISADQKFPNIWNNLSDPPHGDCITLGGAPFGQAVSEEKIIFNISQSKRSPLVLTE